MSINLYSFVKNPFTPQAQFNWKQFEIVVKKAQRLMDDVIDLEEEKINSILEKLNYDIESEDTKIIEKNLWLKIKEKLIQGRRTGLSIIGLADVFAALNLSYGSNSSIDFAGDLYKQFAIYAYEL